MKNKHELLSFISFGKMKGLILKYALTEKKTRYDAYKL